MSKYSHERARENSKSHDAAAVTSDRNQRCVQVVIQVERDFDLHLVECLLEERLTDDHRGYFERLRKFLLSHPDKSLSQRSRLRANQIRRLLSAGKYDLERRWTKEAQVRYQTKRELQQIRNADVRSGRPDWMRDPSKLPKKPPPSSPNGEEVL